MRRFRLTIAQPGLPRAHVTAIARSSAELLAGILERLPLGAFVSVRAL